MEKLDLKVLWIDNEIDLLDIAKNIIINCGYIPLLANSPEEGIKIFKEEMPNIVLVLSDYMMPGMNGFELRNETLSFGMAIPFGIVSAYVTKQMALDALSLKICGFFDKPFKSEQMIELIKKESESRALFLKENKVIEEIFIEEAVSILDDIEPSLLSLDNDRTNSEILKLISRGAHTLKGSSGCLSTNIITKYVHKYEDLVSALQQNQITLTDDVYEVLFKGFDRIKELVYSISSKKIHNYNIDVLLPEIAVVLEKSKENKLIKNEKTDRKIDSSQSQKVKENILVPISMLDELSAYSGEITVLRNMVNKIIRTLEVKYNDNKDIQNLGELFDEMNKINSTIQNRITDLCKIPLTGVFKPIPRIIRDISKDLGKNIQFKIEGENLRVANSLVDVCSNSIIHLVRNSVDHGIETPKERLNSSKSEQGTVQITCLEDNNEVIISIKDDGRGLDPNKIKAKALEKELFSESQIQIMSEKQIFEIIFASGFSTASKLTDVSGRGVGMDMVKSSVEAVGGKIEIESKINQGTIFKLKLPKPKSVLIINSLLIECAERCFAIPEDAIVSVLRIGQEKFNNMVQNLSMGRVLLRDNIIYPLIDLQSVLKLKSDKYKDKSDVEILILKTEQMEYALLIDDILDSEEIVLKRLNSCFNYMGIYSGATFMGDGSIGLILDVKNIAEVAGVKNFNSKIEENSKYILNNSLDSDSVFINYLLFKLESKSIYGISLENIFRLEEIQKSKMQFCGLTKVVTYRDAIMPIYSLENLLNLSSQDKIIDEVKELIVVIVMKRSEGYFGFEVNQIIDIAFSNYKLNQEIRDRVGILGNSVIQDKSVTIIDVNSLMPEEINN